MRYWVNQSWQLNGQWISFVIVNEQTVTKVIEELINRAVNQQKKLNIRQLWEQDCVLSTNRGIVDTLIQDHSHHTELKSTDIQMFANMMQRYCWSSKDKTGRLTVTDLKNRTKVSEFARKCDTNNVPMLLRDIPQCFFHCWAQRKIFVSDLGKSSSFFRIQVDVFNKNTGTSEGQVVEFRSSISGSLGVNNQVSDCFVFNVDSHIVILKSDQRKSQSIVSAKPKLEWCVYVSSSCDSTACSGQSCWIYCGLRWPSSLEYTAANSSAISVIV